MNKKIYDFEQEESNKVEFGAFNTRNVSPELEILQKQREQKRMEDTIIHTPEPIKAPEPPQAPPTPVYREPQEVIEVLDSVDDDEFDAIMEKTIAKGKPSGLESALEKETKKGKTNWMAILFFATSVLLALGLIFVSVKYFGQVSDNAKMEQSVKEADEIKRNNSSQINTLTKQKEDIEAKLKELQKEKEATDKKLEDATASTAEKQKQLDAATQAQAEAAKKIEELQKKVEELQKQIDNIKKAAGA